MGSHYCFARKRTIETKLSFIAHKKYHYQGSHLCTRENLESGEGIIEGVNIFSLLVVRYFPIHWNVCTAFVSLFNEVPFKVRGVYLLQSFRTFCVKDMKSVYNNS